MAVDERPNPLDRIADPVLRQAVVEFAKNGTSPPGHLADRIRTDKDCQAALGYIFDQEMFTYQKFFSELGSPSPSLSSGRPPVKRLSRLTPLLVGFAAVCGFLGLSYGLLTGGERERTERDLVVVRERLEVVSIEKQRALEQAESALEKQTVAERRHTDMAAKAAGYSRDLEQLKATCEVLGHERDSERMRAESAVKEKAQAVLALTEAMALHTETQKKLDSALTQVVAKDKEVKELQTRIEETKNDLIAKQTKMAKLEQELANRPAYPKLSPATRDILALLPYRSKPLSPATLASIRRSQIDNDDPGRWYRAYLLGSILGTNGESSEELDPKSTLAKATDHKGMWQLLAIAEQKSDLDGKPTSLISLLRTFEAMFESGKFPSGLDPAEALAVRTAATQALLSRYGLADRQLDRRQLNYLLESATWQHGKIDQIDKLDSESIAALLLLSEVGPAVLSTKDGEAMLVRAKEAYKGSPTSVQKSYPGRVVAYFISKISGVFER